MRKSGVSAITVAEIYAGMRVDEREKTGELINSLNIIEVTREIAEKARGYKNKIKSHHLEIDDCLISDCTGIFQAGKACDRPYIDRGQFRI